MDCSNKIPGQDSLISAVENRAMFDRIASYYDHTNKILSLGLDRYWRRKAVAALAPEPHGLYLDLGCGTGDVALEILRVSPNSRVIGVDPSEGMLEIGKKKVLNEKLENSIVLESGDALDLRFPQDHFHGAITSFCIRNVTRRKQALQEINRVVRPGGSLIILELTEPQGPVMKPLFRLYGKVVIPTITAFLSSISAYRYLTNSMAAFPKPSSILALMDDAGFVETSYRVMTGGIVTLFAGKTAEKT